MVAVQEKVSKQSKILPDNMKWDGKPDTLRPFLSLVNEWVEIRLGEEAAMVLAGQKKDEHGDWNMAPSIYTVWSQELYLMLRGRLVKDSIAAQAAKLTWIVVHVRSIWNLSERRLVLIITQIKFVDARLDTEQSVVILIIVRVE